MGELNTKDNVEEIKKKVSESGTKLGDIARSLKIAPSKRRILQLSKSQLLQYNALVFHKASTTLSSTQRKMVQERVAYGLNRGTITPGEVSNEINKLNAMIQGELIKAMSDDVSSTKE